MYMSVSVHVSYMCVFVFVCILAYMYVYVCAHTLAYMSLYYTPNQYVCDVYMLDTNLSYYYCTVRTENFSSLKDDYLLTDTLW